MGRVFEISARLAPVPCVLAPRWRSQSRGRPAKATSSGWPLPDLHSAGERFGVDCWSATCTRTAPRRDELELEVGPTPSEVRAKTERSAAPAKKRDEAQP